MSSVRGRRALDIPTTPYRFAVAAALLGYLACGVLLTGVFLVIQLLSTYNPRVLLIDVTLRRHYVVALVSYVVSGRRRTLRPS